MDHLTAAIKTEKVFSTIHLKNHVKNINRLTFQIERFLLNYFAFTAYSLIKTNLLEAIIQLPHRFQF